MRLWHIWSQTQMVPDIWSPTIGPQLIGPSGQRVPNQFGLHGQMVPKNSVPIHKWSSTNLVPLDRWSLEYSVSPRGQAVGIWKFGDQIGWGPNRLGPICPGWPIFLGSFVHEDQIWWGSFVQGDQFYWDHLSRGTGSGGPEVRVSNGFGTKCVTANMKYIIKKLKVSCRKINSCPIAIPM